MKEKWIKNCQNKTQHQKWHGLTYFWFMFKEFNMHVIQESLWEIENKAENLRTETKISKRKI